MATQGFFYYASFPNSRNKLRSATVQANTYQVAIADYTLPLTLISPANLNRTYITLENFSVSQSMFYLYATASAVNPMTTPTNGVPEELVYDIAGNILYQKQDYGTTINWLVVLPQNVGEKVFPTRSASLDSLQDVYAFANSAIPLVPPIIVGVDEGRG